MKQAERRERQLQNFNNEFIKDERKAHYILNSYYRLCGLDERLLYLDNNERTCNSLYTKQETERALRWVKRLDTLVNEYGLNIAYSGYLPSIVVMDKEKKGCIVRDVVYAIYGNC